MDIKPETAPAVAFALAYLIVVVGGGILFLI